MRDVDHQKCQWNVPIQHISSGRRLWRDVTPTVIEQYMFGVRLSTMRVAFHLPIVRSVLGSVFFGVPHTAHSWPVCPPRHTYAQHTRYYTKNHENQNTNFYCLFELIKNLPATLNVISQETLTDESRENNRNKYLMKFETNTLAVNFCE